MTDYMTDQYPDITTALKAEQAVIGIALFDNTAYWNVCDIVRPEDFFDPVHRMIFDCIGARIRGKESVDPLTVDRILGKEIGYQEANGRQYLEDLISSVPPVISAKNYADLVADMATQRRALDISRQACADFNSLGNRDLRKVIGEVEQSLQSLVLGGDRRPVVSLGHDDHEWFDQILNPKEEAKGFATGLTRVDNLLGGLQPGEMLVLGARPSMGKTALAESVAFGAMRHGVGVHFQSLEMRRKGLYYRMLSDVCRDYITIPYADMVKGKIPSHAENRLVAARDVIAAMPMQVDDNASATVEDIAASVRRSKTLMAQKGIRLGVVVVDYLQFIDYGPQYAVRRMEGAGNVSRAMKRLAERLDVCVILLSQLNRSCENREDKRPMMSDLRETGDIEQDADSIGLLLRPEYYLGKDDQATDEDKANAKGQLMLFIDKNRNGPIGTINLDIDVACNAVRNQGDLYGAPTPVDQYELTRGF